MIILVWSFLTFLNILPIIEDGGKYTEIGISNPVEMHLLLHFESTVARLCIVAVSGRVWKQTGPTMV